MAQWERILLQLQEMQETPVESLGWEDFLEEEMAIRSSRLAWRILWTEEPGGLQSMESKRVDMTEQLTLSFNEISSEKQALNLDNNLCISFGFEFFAVL